MTIARRDRYYCATHRQKGTCEAKHGIAAADLEARVLDGLKRLLTGNEVLLQAFADEFRAELERLRGARRKDEGKLRRKLTEAERGIAHCLDFILSGDGAPASVRTKLQELETSKCQLEGELASLTDSGPPAVEIHPNVPEPYRRKVATLAELLEDEDTRTEAMHAIRSLVDRVEIGPPDEERSPCTVTLVGALASVLAFVSERENAAGQAGCLARSGTSGMPKRHPVRGGVYSGCGGPIQRRTYRKRPALGCLVSPSRSQICEGRSCSWICSSWSSGPLGSAHALPDLPLTSPLAHLARNLGNIADRLASPAGGTAARPRMRMRPHAMLPPSQADLPSPSIVGVITHVSASL